MLKINKASEDIAHFNSWAKSKKLREWKELASKQSVYFYVYEELRDYIEIIEQDGLSPYTEKPLGSKIHIDHFKKRNLYPDLTFDYANLLVDDLDDNYGACHKDNHSSVNSASFDGVTRIFCPTTENMADFVEYTFEGMIVSKIGLDSITAKRVNETIRIFNLNHSVLKKRRADIIRFIKDYQTSGLSDNEIRESMRLSGFPTLVNWVLTKT